MILIFVESPNKARAINEYLKGEKENYKVLSTVGHVRNLSAKSGSVNVEKDFEYTWDYTPQWIKNKKDIIENAKKADKIIIASDPDREGEAIAWHLSELLKMNKITCPILRMIFHSVSKASIKEALKNTMDIRSGLVNSYLARVGLDYLFGYSISPLLWHKVPCCKSAGRVQSAALKMIVERENEIVNFISKKYLTIHAKFKESTMNALLMEFNGEKFENGNIFETKIDIEKLKKHKFEIVEIKKQITKQNTYSPLITSTLQQYASSLLNFSPVLTMQLAQKLYEGFTINKKHTGLITYMRTDSFNIEKNALMQIRDKIKEKYGAKYLSEQIIEHKKSVKNAQEAHEAIRPVDINLEPEMINFEDENLFKLYKLIWERTIISQFTPAIIEKMNIKIEGKDETDKSNFELKNSKIIFASFKEIIQNEEDNEDEVFDNLSNLSENQILNLNELISKDHETQPPKRFSEATFIQQLEKKGIGRPSTFTKIPSVLYDREYAIKTKKIISPTQKGWLVTAFLENFFKQEINSDFTANMEEQLDELMNSNESYLKVIKNFWDILKSKIDIAQVSSPLDVASACEKSFPKYFLYEKNICKCGQPFNLKITKYGAMRGCQNYPNCKETIQVNATEKKNESLGLSENNENIFLKTGPYGPYIEIEQEKPKRIPIPKIWAKDLENFAFEKALFLASLPKNIGEFEGKPILLNIGRFGPYLQYDKKFISIQDPITITLNEAIEKIKKKLSI